MILLLAAQAMAACPATAEALEIDAGRALDAYRALDLEAFGTASAAVLAEAACLTDPATPELAARVHLVAALRAWVDKDGAGMLARFRGMRGAQPTLDLDPAYAPPGSRPRIFFEMAGEPAGARAVPLPTDAGRRWDVDGHIDSIPVLPADRAVLVQRLGPGDAVERSWYFPVSVALADVVDLPPPTAPVDAAPVPRVRPPPGPSRRLLGIGAVTAGVGVAGLVSAGLLREAYIEAGPGDGTLDGLYAANLASGSVGFAACAVGAGLATVAVVQGRW